MSEIVASARAERPVTTPASPGGATRRSARRAGAERVAERREPRKIRYTHAEWATVVRRARECGKPPARYVREVSLGAVPKAKRSVADAELIREIGRIGNTLHQLAKVAAERDVSLRPEALADALAELLAAVRRID